MLSISIRIILKIELTFSDKQTKKTAAMDIKQETVKMEID